MASRGISQNPGKKKAPRVMQAAYFQREMRSGALIALVGEIVRIAWGIPQTGSATTHAVGLRAKLE